MDKQNFLQKSKFGKGKICCPDCSPSFFSCDTLNSNMKIFILAYFILLLANKFTHKTNMCFLNHGDVVSPISNCSGDNTSFLFGVNRPSFVGWLGWQSWIVLLPLLIWQFQTFVMETSDNKLQNRTLLLNSRKCLEGIFHLDLQKLTPQLYLHKFINIVSCLLTSEVLFS